MRSKQLSEQGQATYALVFDKGDEAMAGLLTFARERRLAGSSFTAIGAFSRATLGYFDRQRKDYARIAVDQQVEVLSLVGDIALVGDEPKVHGHVVLGRSDGSTVGGHLLEAYVWPTLEVVITESPKHLRRRYDPETGLALLDL